MGRKISKRPHLKQLKPVVWLSNVTKRRQQVIQYYSGGLH